MFEEWWGRTFEGRGTLLAIHLPNPTTPADMRRLATVDVLELIRSEDNRSVRGLLAHMERRRREEFTARFALGVAILSLVVSVAALALKKS